MSHKQKPFPCSIDQTLGIQLDQALVTSAVHQAKGSSTHHWLPGPRIDGVFKVVGQPHV